MKIIRYVSVGIFLSTCLAACSPGEAPITAGQAPIAEPPAVEAIVGEYFDRLAAYDFLGMRALTTPTFETLDGGVRLTHPELEDYIRNTAQLRGAALAFDLSQFDTRIVGDVAHVTFHMNLSGREYLDAVILQRSGGEWLFDRWFHSSGINERPESIIRQFYHHIKAYNYDGMRTMVTPGFRVMYSGQSLDWERFEEFHRAEEAEEGPASSRPERFLYELSDFQIESTPEVVYATFLQTSHEVDRDYWNLFVLRRIGSDWRVHFVGSLQGAEQVP